MKPYLLYDNGLIPVYGEVTALNPEATFVVRSPEHCRVIDAESGLGCSSGHKYIILDMYPAAMSNDFGGIGVLEKILL